MLGWKTTKTKEPKQERTTPRGWSFPALPSGKNEQTAEGRRGSKEGAGGKEGASHPHYFILLMRIVSPHLSHPQLPRFNDLFGHGPKASRERSIYGIPLAIMSFLTSSETSPSPSLSLGTSPVSSQNDKPVVVTRAAPAKTASAHSSSHTP